MRKVLGLILLLFVATSSAYEYKKQPGVAGTVSVVGSDTMANLVALWSQHFKQIYPHLNVQMQAVGSATAPTALTEGVASIGSMSRKLKASEIEYFRRKYGYAPTVLKVALDAIILFVSLDNPVSGLSMQDVDAIFSITRFCGSGKSIDNWRQLGVTIGEKGLPIKLYGRNSVSGTYGLFKQKALCKGDFKSRVNEMPSSASIIQSVAYAPGGLGYAAFGYAYSGVKVLSISEDDGMYIPANAESIASGDYPLSRTLYLIVNKKPGEPLPTMIKEFLLFVLSMSGQELVKKAGYVSVLDKDIRRQLSMIRD